MMKNICKKIALFSAATLTIATLNAKTLEPEAYIEPIWKETELNSFYRARICNCFLRFMSESIDEEDIEVQDAIKALDFLINGDSDEARN